MLHTMTVSPGVTLQYEERGLPSGIPILFLHGLSDSWRSFEPVLDCLPAGIRAIALTLRGHGDSSRPASGYGIEDLAGDVHLFMRRLALPAAVVVGHSMGSLVAQRLALYHPDRVAGLVLLGAFAALPPGAAVHALRETIDRTPGEQLDAGVVRAFQQGSLAHHIPEDRLETMVRESLKVPARVWQQLLRGVLSAPNCAEALGGWRIPSLIVWGDRDRFTTEARQAQLSDWLGARIVRYQGAGHAMHWEEPARIARETLDFTYARRYDASIGLRRIS